MDTTLLKNFVEIAREGSMTAAAEALHISQPTLSVQMKNLENEIGKKLFKKQGRNITLTDEGFLLRKRAMDILDIVDKTYAEFQEMNILNGGDVRIGCAESYLIGHLANTIKKLRQNYPRLHYHITSGDSDVVIERLDRGILDFAIIVEPPNLSRYNYIELPGTDTWGLVMPKNHPLATKEFICFEDLLGQELIVSEQSFKADFPRWCKERIDQLNFTGFTTLFYNGTVFVKAGLGLLLTFEHLVENNSDLSFRPLNPTLENKMYIIWKKYQVFTPIAEVVINALQSDFA
ncbi:MAG: LysR family transcriptional regulator [Acidaminococcaceae bacterium]